MNLDASILKLLVGISRHLNALNDENPSPLEFYRRCIELGDEAEALKREAHLAAARAEGEL